MIDKSPYRRKLPKLFASLAIISFSIIAVMNNFIVSGISIDSNLVIFMLKLSIPAAFVLGYIGYLIGQILDNRSVRARAKANLLPFSKKDIQEAYSIDSIFSSSVPDEAVSLDAVPSQEAVNEI